MSSAPTSHWESPPALLAIANDETHVWRVALDAPAPRVGGLFELLSPLEREQAQRFTFADGRRRFTVARGTLRHILARYLETEPNALELGTGPHGKPFLHDNGNTPHPAFGHPLPSSDEGRGQGEGCSPAYQKTTFSNLAGSNPCEIQFNVSHTRERAVIAVAWRREVGIDIEAVDRAVDMENLARRFFSPAEAQAVLAAGPSERQLVFFRIWTTKEAYIKARGEGLSLPLDQFDVVTDLRQPPGLLATRNDPADKGRWQFVEISCGENYRCTIAVKGAIGQLRCWEG